MLRYRFILVPWCKPTRSGLGLSLAIDLLYMKEVYALAQVFSPKLMANFNLRDEIRMETTLNKWYPLCKPINSGLGLSLAQVTVNKTR